jgi:CDP-glucose 4,6-dehydratase
MQADHSMPEEFWRGRRVLLTGHTGFKGAWLSLWLRRWEAEVTGYALAPSSTPDLWSIVAGDSPSIIGDIRDFAHLRAAVNQTNPQIVIHMAAQALVKESYRDPLGTYATNVLGTGTLLQACRELAGLQCVVIVTSDKVYENDGAGRPFEEGDRLGGHDPYSNSKACAELLTASFRESFFSNAQRPSRRFARATSSAAATGPPTVSFPIACGRWRGASPCGSAIRTPSDLGSMCSNPCPATSTLARALVQTPAAARRAP